jgi:hypothetical protein
MGFRFRRSARLGPLRFNYRFAGLRLQQGWAELDLRWRPWRLLQHSCCSQRRGPHHRGLARHWPQLERGALTV